MSKPVALRFVHPPRRGCEYSPAALLGKQPTPAQPPPRQEPEPRHLPEHIEPPLRKTPDYGPPAPGIEPPVPWPQPGEENVP
jgi:hypothetical protein